MNRTRTAVAIASDPGGTTSGPGLQALCDGFGFAQAELARQMKVVRERVTTSACPGAVPRVAEQPHVDALKAVAA